MTFLMNFIFFKKFCHSLLHSNLKKKKSWNSPLFFKKQRNFFLYTVTGVIQVIKLIIEFLITHFLLFNFLAYIEEAIAPPLLQDKQKKH